MKPGLQNEPLAGALERALEGGGGLEADRLARLYLHLLAGPRIAAHAGGALPDAELAEAGDLDLAGLHAVVHDGVEHAVDDLARGARVRRNLRAAPRN